jgi:hypothetical protein
MKDDVRKTVFSTLIIFSVGVVIWVAFLFLNACGFSLACDKGIPNVERTPIPTLMPAAMPAADMNMKAAPNPDVCRVAAADLIGAWVAAGSSEKEAFEFTDTDARTCEATFADVQPLFIEPNFWANGSTSCVSCHAADMKISLAQLDLTSYEGIQSGSRRADAESKGTDILGGGKWESSLLYQFLAEAKADVPGHETSMKTGYFVFVGKPVTP